jgi:diguanylate cyclase (GGDEF)-like protein/PAS domain S-box-containing protein
MGSETKDVSLEGTMFRIGQWVTHPLFLLPMIVTYSIWMFFHDNQAHSFNLWFSASIEWTKALFAFVAFFGSIRLAKKEAIVGWQVVAGACVFWFIGEVIYGFFIIRSGRPDLPVSYADIFFLIAIPLAIIGVFMVGLYGLKTAERLRIALDALAFAAAIAFISMTFLVELADRNQPVIQGTSWRHFFFFILDIVFASLALCMMLYRRFDKMIVPFGVGMILQASADMMWVTDQFRDSFVTRPFARVFLLTAAALYCFSATRTSGKPMKPSTAFGERQLRLGVFAIVFCAIVFAIVKLPGSERIHPIVAFCFVVLFIATLLGQIVSHYENHKLTSEQAESLDAISESEERFRIAFENGPTGLLLVDHDGFIVKANKAFSQMLMQDAAELIDAELILLIHPDDRETHLRMSMNILNRTSRSDYEARFIERDGSVSWGSVSVSEMPAIDGTSYMVYQIEDISDRKTSEQRLQYLAIHDPLTGLANRTYFMERVNEALNTATARHQPLAVLFLDLDRFKVINDSLGHSVGDQVIQTISHRIRKVVGTRGTVARFGGDEFTVLIAPPTNDQQAHLIAKEILDEVIKPFPLEDGDAYISCSIGLVLTDGEITDPQSLLRDADSAMYRAKELGRNRIETADHQVHKRVMKELRTVNELHRAVKQSELKVFYQPIVRLDTQELTGFEALVRWLHPERGIIGPDDFISMAEDTGLILDIGNMVMKEAFSQVALWQQSHVQSDGSPISMSVNLAVRQLSDPNLLDSLQEIKSTAHAHPDSMILEITESVLLGDTRHAITILNEIHSMGYRLRVDDFGTGYSSLTYLKRFPLDGFKIDKSFVAGLDIDDNDTAIVHALIGLAHSMHLNVVAEGIETQAALDALTELGCHFGQGYLFARAKPAHEIDIDKIMSFVQPQEDPDSSGSSVINLHSRRTS